MKLFSKDSNFIFVPVLQENVSVVVSRLVVSDIASSLSSFTPEVSKEIAHHTLTSLQSRAISFEEQVGTSPEFEIMKKNHCVGNISP